MFVPLSAIDLLLRLQAGGTAGTRLSRDLLGGLVPVGLVPVDLGWGGRVRTFAWRNQNPLPYHLATPQKRADHSELAPPPQCILAANSRMAAIPTMRAVSLNEGRAPRCFQEMSSSAVYMSAALQRSIKRRSMPEH